MPNRIQGAGLYFYSHAVFLNILDRPWIMLCVTQPPPKWGIDFQEGSFHYCMPATLHLDYSLFSKSQKHCKSTCSRVLGGGGGWSLFLSLMRCLVVSIQGVMRGVMEELLCNFPQPINSFGFLHTLWLRPLRCRDVIYFSDLVIPLSCVKVQRQSVTEMDWAVNLPHRSPQTHSLCHRYPEAAAASFPPFPREHWQVKGLDKSYISLSFQISHHEGFATVWESVKVTFRVNTNGVVPLTKSQSSSKPAWESVNKYCIFGDVKPVETFKSMKLQSESKIFSKSENFCADSNVLTSGKIMLICNFNLIYFMYI